MADDFAEHLLRSTLALMCKEQGWHTASHLSLVVFSKIARCYLRNIGILTLRYSIHNGKYEPNLNDLAGAFSELGITLGDLQQFWSETGSHSGAPQVCKFPVDPPLNLQENVISNPPDFIPDYLPPFIVAEEPANTQDTTVKEDVTVVAENTPTSDQAGADPFDEAVAVPTPCSNFPFINKEELPEPKISSWGFQRVTIDSKPTILSPSSHDNKVSNTSPDNFVISENSDDFIFASKHSKSKEENKKKYASIENSDSPIKVNNNNESVLNSSVFEPSLGTSTPMNTEQNTTKQSSENGILNCKQQLFHTNNLTTIQEESSGFVPDNNKEFEVPVCPKTPDINRPDSPTDFGNSTFDELTSKETFDKLLKTLSPSKPVIVEKPPSPQLKSTSPPNKRRKLDKPQLIPSTDDRKLLKNCPDLMRNEKITKTKPECKLLSNNHHSDSNHKKVNNIDTFEKIKLSIKRPKNHEHKSKKIKENAPENHNENQKVKKKQRGEHKMKCIDLFEDSTINLSGPDKVEKTKTKSTPKVIPSKKLVTNTASNHISEPKLSPITLSLGKKDSKPDVKIEKSKSVETLPAPTLKVKLKAPNKNSKYKSKPIIEEEDDLSSLSSDSLDGFEDLIPKDKPKKKVITNRCMVKTKAELKNPCPPSPSGSISPASPSVFPETSKKKKNVTTKIKIEKPSSPAYSTVSPNPNKTAPVKLKLPIPLPLQTSFNSDVLNATEFSEKSLRIDESYVSNKSVICEDGGLGSGATSGTNVSLKIPKIKIKLGGNHLPQPQSPISVPSPPSFKISPPESPKISHPPLISLKLKLPTDPNKSENVFETKEKPKVKKSKEPKASKSSKVKPSVIQYKEKGVKEKSIKEKSVKEKPVKEKPLKEKPVKEKPVKEKTMKEKTVVSIDKEKPTKVIKFKAIQPQPDIDHVSNNDVPSQDTTPLSESAASLESTLISETVVSETVVADSVIDPIKIWYCPKCVLPDDGSPMVGCDTCDEWYHWPCVGLSQAPPDNVDWYCPPCIKKTKSQKKVGKRKRKT